MVCQVKVCFEFGFFINRIKREFFSFKKKKLNYGVTRNFRGSKKLGEDCGREENAPIPECENVPSVCRLVLITKYGRADV